MSSPRVIAPFLAPLLFLLTACSSSPGGCPTCGTGMVCDEATRTCVPAASPQCPAAGCGPNASCRSDDRCACQAGWTDCNGDLVAASSDGCECDRACEGTTCGITSTCSALRVGSCGASTSYCDAASTCAPCPPGKYNCDGVNDCESSQSCGVATCSPTRVGDCSTAQHCADGACLPCPAGTHNCDGVGLCESSVACGTPAGCVPECTGSYEYLCLKNPAQNNRCEECLENAHCRANPRSNGPTCDTSDLAGTSFNFCICQSEADCASSTVGLRCQAGPNPSIKTCTCSTDQDCPASHRICEGSLFKRCQKACSSSADCDRGAVQGSCDTATGKCSFPDF